MPEELEEKGPSAAYKAICAVFNSSPSDVLEIEVLPHETALSDDSLLLKDGPCIGIPKKVLVQAFLHARLLFLQRDQKADQQKVLEATKIILLCDPEFLTAANHRKRKLQRVLQDVDSDKGLTAAREFIFLNSILSSPLHRQSKSPTLWHHRLWVLRTFFDSLLSGMHLCQPRSALWSFASAELDIICRSGERHEKNYYAWQYGRRLFETIQIHSTPSQFLDVLKSATDKVFGWCQKNLRDTSGWSFLAFLLQLYGPGHSEYPCDVLSRALDMVLKFDFHYESVWAFFRATLASSLLPQTARRGFVEKIQKYASTEDYACKFPSILSNISWIHRYVPP